MGDIFISYSREDHQAAERLAAALKADGWSVWWDPDIPPGEIWDELIEKELAGVSCVVVLWSASSVQKQWVKAEATEAMARGILVPAFIENVKPPLAFRQVQAAPLADWRGETEHGGFQQLLATIRTRIVSHPQRGADVGTTAATLPERRAGKSMHSANLEVAPRSRQRRSTRPIAEPGLAAPGTSSHWSDRRHPRLTRVGAAIGWLILGGMIGYVLDDVVRWLSGQALP